MRLSITAFLIWPWFHVEMKSLINKTVVNFQRLVMVLCVCVCVCVCMCVCVCVCFMELGHAKQFSNLSDGLKSSNSSVVMLILREYIHGGVPGLT